jgi:hypothetical protein
MLFEQTLEGQGKETSCFKAVLNNFPSPSPGDIQRGQTGDGYSPRQHRRLSAGLGLSIILTTLERQPWYLLPVDQVLNRRAGRMRFPRRVLEN